MVHISSNHTFSDESGVFMQCYAQNPTSNVTALLQCVSNTMQHIEEDRATSLHSFLLVTCGAMIFFMQAGFAMLCAGSVRLKNVQNTMLKNLLDACGAAIAFFLLGTFCVVLLCV
jgi:hypothetical protein